jgi:3-oxoacyl-[acyl-carrier-protein] synthase-1
MGLVSSLGSGAKETWDNCLENRTDFFKSDKFLCEQRTAVLGRAKHISPLPERWQHLNSRNNRLAYTAYLQIQNRVEQALTTYPKQRIAIVMGTSTGGMAGTEDIFSRYNEGEPAKDFDYSAHEVSSLGMVMSKMIGSKGICYTIATACSSSTNAMISGARLLESGLMDAVIVGGVDSLCKMTTNGFNSLSLVSKQQNKPFMKERDGLNIGEAAALAILERKPGGIQLVGYGQSSDAYHMSAPEPEGVGAQKAMTKALQKARLQPGDINYINLHGTGTMLNDQAEARAVHKIFGESVLCSSTKSLTGHTLGAAGALECALSWLSLTQPERSAYFPPHTTGEYDDQLPPIRLVRGREPIDLERDIYILSNSFAFGGNNSSLIIGRERQ